MIDTNKMISLNPEELLKELYGEELRTKKDVLQYIEMAKILKKTEGVPDSLKEGTYKLISDSIDNMHGKVKPNTIMFLKNQLKTDLGKLVKGKEEFEESSFIKFFKRAYPEGKRTKSFTYVIQDNSMILDEQIWTTLTYINRESMRGQLFLSAQEKKEIIEMIGKLMDKGNIKYVNQVKSMDKLLRKLNIKIVEGDNGFEIEEMKNSKR
ncbi:MULTISPECIES: hypothetical protein [Clostridium]|uniref:Uncharacterized protein n=1 Tax=Clostridium cadaveris TaxID=1529 RepID=A0A1I2PCZ4_9CLOT|nr:hypothetical protein [Clostridium cadaveris]MDU4953067.1 hypothetical protein [Clostridium sp.]MDM8311665.1 hypothetical protein [Clostridium cadaveris]MDY4947755.1 hypothetical protein [Clostridium cadaveris]NME64296.1 hypothetical protein [Clostridium cadaveris]NWK11065.1 hypothetical protein [Clostridium cadaveris]